MLSNSNLLGHFADVIIKRHAANFGIVKKQLEEQWQDKTGMVSIHCCAQLNPSSNALPQTTVFYWSVLKPNFLREVLAVVFHYLVDEALQVAWKGFKTSLFLWLECKIERIGHFNLCWMYTESLSLSTLRKITHVTETTTNSLFLQNKTNSGGKATYQLGSEWICSCSCSRERESVCVCVCVCAMQKSFAPFFGL